MKYIFFGSPRFATVVLMRLMDAGFTPAALVCNPDRPFGRKQVVTPPPTKELMIGRLQTAPILQPEKITSSFADELRVLAPDFFMVAAYAQIIPEAILEVPRIGTLGVHPSLLPQYRGSSPIQSALLSGEAKTGSTIYLMDSKMDHGPILAQESLSIASDDTYDSLELKLANLSGSLLVATIPDFAEGKSASKPQDETQATYTKKFAVQDGFVDERDLVAAKKGDGAKATVIYNKIRALNPEPGVWTESDGKRLKLLEANIENERLVLKKIQNEGERPRTM